MTRPARPRRDVLVCRDCCCGTDKHPGTDHDAQRDALLAAADAAPGVRVRVVECLDTCEESNVVLVRDLARPRRDPARDTWLGGVLEPGTTDAVAAWVRDGGPLPETLRGHRFVPELPGAP